MRGEMFDAICSFKNLYEAYRRARKGKRRYDKPAEFEVNLEKNLHRLREELLSGTYAPGGYRVFYVREPKLRRISAAPFRDRVVHQALCAVIEPVFDRHFIFDSYANRVGKGTHKAILRIEKILRSQPYVLKCDIAKYFPSIDHGILKETIRKKIHCPKTLRLIDAIIDGSNPQEDVFEYFEGDTLFTPVERRKGLPIGNLTSQFFANIYLDPLDHYIKEVLRIRHYIRYVDDFVIGAETPKELGRILSACETFLEQYRLRLHPGKCVVILSVRGVNTLGFKSFGEKRFLRRDNKIRAIARFREFSKRLAVKPACRETIRRSLTGWEAHAQFANTQRLRCRLRKKFSILPWGAPE